MKKRESTPAEAAERAEARLRSKTVGENLPRTVAEMRRILDELQRQQAELELQNEELRRIWEGLELSPNKFDKLYNLSPIGYFTFDAHGLIRDVNPAGSQLLGIDARLLVNKPFFSFIADAGDRDIFSNHLKSVLQREGMQKCEIRLTRKDGTVTYWQLQSVGVDVETIETKDVFILTSIVDGTFGIHFGKKLKTAHDKLELTVNERTGELTREMQFLAHLYRFFGNPHPNHQNASRTPTSTFGFDTLNGAAIGQDGDPEKSTQSSTSVARKIISYLTFSTEKNLWLYGLCALVIIAAVSIVLLQSKRKTTDVEQRKADETIVRPFGLHTSARKMNQEKNFFAVIKFMVRPEGVIYIDGEKKGEAPMFKELQVKEGKHTIAIKYKNNNVYKKVVNLAPQEIILIEHSFSNSTATVTKKNITASEPTNNRENAPRIIYPAVFTPKMRNKTSGNSTSKSKKGVRKIYPAAFSATHTKKKITVNERSIKRLPNSLVRVWIKIEDDPQSMIKAQEKIGLPTQGYDKFSHTLVLWEYDCRKQTYRSIQINDYATNGKVLWSTPVSKSIMQPIVHNSVGETLYKIVCQGSK